jgi:DNA invertase Pin-like site-specific DNA recombinase
MVAGSLEQQEKMIHRWAKNQSEKHPTCEYKVDRIIVEDISGSEDSLKKRHGLKQLRAAIKSRQIDFFVI